MATEKKQAVYDESHIKTLSFPDNIRQKPTLYIGPINEDGILTILREVADNVVDEALAGRASKCDIFIHTEEDSKTLKGFYVLDNGAGIPVKGIKIKSPDGKSSTTVPAILAVLTMTHTSGKFDDKAYATARGCFTGDTRIRLLNGKTATMEQLHQRWQEDQSPIPLMSFNRRTQKLEPSNISHVQITKETRNLVKVKIDDGSVVNCTPDHPFYVYRGGSIRKVHAERLKQGDSLVSTYYGHDKDGYLKQTEQGSWRKVHRVVGEHLYEVRKGIDEIHHVSKNIEDNRPSNLECLTKAEHQREHQQTRSKYLARRIMDDQSDLRAENSARLTDQNADPDFIVTAHQTKVTRIAARALIHWKRLDKETYDSVRRGVDPSYKKAIGYFNGRGNLLLAAQEHVEYLRSRQEVSSRAEAALADLYAEGQSPDERSRIANWKKSIKTWTEVLVQQPDPSMCTPEEFNFFNRKGAVVFGRYATMRMYTSLKWLKAHVLDGEPLKLFEDQSEEAKRSRRLQAEIKMRAPSSLRMMLRYFIRTLVKHDVWTEEKYMAVKPSCAPVWDFANAILLHLHGDVDLKEFAHNSNHEVISVKIDRRKERVPVYDITVDKTHTFFLEPGVLVSNTHGLGVKASNALSRKYHVWTFREDQWWEIAFAYGLNKLELRKCKAPKHPASGQPIKKGTLVYLEPDPKIFEVMQDRTLASIMSGKSPTLRSLLEWCRLASYFTPGLALRVSHYSGNVKVFESDNGPLDYVTRKLKTLTEERRENDGEKAEAIQLIDEKAQFASQDALYECVVAFTNCENANIDAFTNGLRNAEGGLHMSAMLNALHAAIQPFAGKANFTQRELREGLVALINVKLSAPQFDSQTKEKLVDVRAGKPVFEKLSEEFGAFFKKRPTLARRICDRAASLHALRSKFMASKKVVSSLRAIAKKGLPVVGTVAPDCSTKERELFLIEGTSAAGTARNARDEYYQETLPLKGKVTNALRDEKGKALENEEVINVLAQIGFDPKAEDPLSKLRVGKIISLADPDPDGPLVGDTEIPIRFNGEWMLERIENLASERWDDTPYDVLAWNGRSYCIADDVRCEVTGFVNRLVTVTLANGKKIRCSEHHELARAQTKPTYDYLPSQTGLVMVPACELKAGNYLVTPEENGMMKHAWRNIPGMNQMHGVLVEKVKISEVENVPVFCLTVPAYHNFVLGCGVVSKNCHINSLLLTLIYKYLPGLFEMGMVYVAEVPEFYAIPKTGKPLFASSPAKLQKKLDEAEVKAEIKHIKGYGEVDADILRTLAFNPKTRNIIRIVPTEASDGEVSFIKLMSGGSESRKALLGI